MMAVIDSPVNLFIHWPSLSKVTLSFQECLETSLIGHLPSSSSSSPSMFLSPDLGPDSMMVGEGGRWVGMGSTVRESRNSSIPCLFLVDETEEKEEQEETTKRRGRGRRSEKEKKREREKEERAAAILQLFFPFPVGFELVGEVKGKEQQEKPIGRRGTRGREKEKEVERGGEETFYVWRPLPQKHYAALGMVVTTSSAPPPLSSVRTLPRSLTRPCPREGKPRSVFSSSSSSCQLYINGVGLVVGETLSGWIPNLELNVRDTSPCAKQVVTLEEAFSLS